MVILADGDLLDLSKQLVNTQYSYNKTYLFSFRKIGDETIELSELEHKICLLARNSISYEHIVVDLLHEYDFNMIENACNRLKKLDILKNTYEYKISKARILNPYNKAILGVRHFPRSIVWNITNKCNLNCKHCITNYFDEKKDLNLNGALIKNLVSEMDRFSLERLQISGGEPLCSPYLFEILQRTLETQICVDVFTNATMISEKEHDFFARYLSERPRALTFHISLDGSIQSHNYLRQNDNAYQKTVENIKKIINYNGTINIETIIHEKNIETIEDFICSLIDLKIQQVYMHPIFYLGNNEKITEPELSIDQHFLIYKKLCELKRKYKDNITINYADEFFPVIPYFLKNMVMLPPSLQNNTKNKVVNCLAGIEKMFISATGEIYPCLLYDNSERDFCGNIKNTTLIEAWESSGMNNVRKPIFMNELLCGKCLYSQFCKGKIRSCRRGIEMQTNNYYGNSAFCEFLNNSFR